jgi:hypothetical protein
MIQSVEGIYHNGKVELLETPPTVSDARVIVTFLPANGPIDLASRQIDSKQAESLRVRLRAFEEDWLRPEMDAYDAL